MNRNAQILSTPVLIDSALFDISTHLVNKLTWLNTAFGKCEHQTDNDGHTKPVIYSSKNEYVDLFPDQKKGNFSFFDIEDGAKISHSGLRTTISAKGSLIFWGNYETAFDKATADKHSIENLKLQIDEALKTLNRPLLRITPNAFFERPKNVYKGFDISKIDNTRTMRPYFCLRCYFDFNYTEAVIC